jgi:hypothetical protein
MVSFPTINDELRAIMLIECKCQGVAYINPKQVSIARISTVTSCEEELSGHSELRIWLTGDEYPILFINHHNEILRYAEKLDGFFNESH